MATDHTACDELAPELEKLAQQLNACLSSARSSQLHLFWKRLQEMQPETMNAPNQIKFLFGQLANEAYAGNMGRNE